MNIVVITSALHTGHGVFNTQQRINQTVDTVWSVKRAMPNSVTILADMSTEHIHTDQSSDLAALRRMVDFWIDNTRDPVIQEYHRMLKNEHIAKNVMEAQGLIRTFNTMLTSGDIQRHVRNCKRIFKLSGRYTITPEFDLKQHDNDATRMCWVFAKGTPVQTAQQHLGSEYQLQTRLWSFDKSLLPATANLYQQVQRQMVDCLNQGLYVDSEHMMGHLVPPNQLVQLSRMGVAGTIAPTGHAVSD
jgi:hypothetical protein